MSKNTTRIAWSTITCGITLAAASSYGHPNQGLENLGTLYLWFYCLAGYISALGTNLPEAQQNLWDKHMNQKSWPVQLLLARVACIGAIILTAYDGRYFFAVSYIIGAGFTEIGYRETRERFGG